MSVKTFYNTLKLIGYPRVNDLNPESFEWIEEDYPEFIEWFCNTIGEGNILTTAEFESYKELESAGLLRNESLSNDSLTTTCIEDHDVNAVNDVTDNIKEITRNHVLKEIEALNYFQHHLSQWRPEMSDKIAATEKIHNDCKKQADLAVKHSQAIDHQINDLAEELQWKLNKLDEQLQNCNGHDSPFRFAHTYISDILDKEEKYNQLLKNFLDTQFPQNLPFETLDDDDSPANVTRIHEQEKLCIEAEMLHNNLIKSYEKWMQERLLEIGESATDETLSKIKMSMDSGTFPTESTLRTRIHVINKELSDKKEQIFSLKEKVWLLIRQLSEATARSVFIEGCDLKCSRQMYFMSKFDEVIELLTHQTTSCMLVSWLIKEEQDILGCIHETLLNLYKRVKDELHNNEKQLIAVEELKKIVKNRNLEENAFQNYLKKLKLQQRDEEGQPKKIIGRFGFNVKKCISETYDKEQELSEAATSNFTDLQKRLQTGAQNLSDLQTVIWRDCNSFNVAPNTIPKAVAEGIEMLESQQKLQRETLDQTIAYYNQMRM